MTDKIYGYKENRSRTEVLSKDEAVKDIRVEASAAGVNIKPVNGNDIVTGGGCSAHCKR